MLEKRSATQLTAVHSEKVVNRTKTNLKQKESYIKAVLFGYVFYIRRYRHSRRCCCHDAFARKKDIRSIKLDRAVRIAKIWVIEYIQKYGLQRQESFRLQRKAAVTSLLPDAEKPQADPGISGSVR
jgi:hypothetical protein